MKLRKLTFSGILIAISVVLVYFIRFPLFVPFLEYDPADISIFIATFLMGTPIGLIITVIVSVLQGLTVSGSSGVIGIIMHVFATGSYVLVAGLIYNRKKNVKNLIIAIIAGIITSTVGMILWNIIFTPLFLGQSLSSVLPMILPIILPFNLIKMGVNSTLAFIIFQIIKKYNDKAQII
ncbi:MAG: ECF transporter S component [Clostridia bacterium]